MRMPQGVVGAEDDGTRCGDGWAARGGVSGRGRMTASRRSRTGDMESRDSEGMVLL